MHHTPCFVDFGDHSSVLQVDAVSAWTKLPLDVEAVRCYETQNNTKYLRQDFNNNAMKTWKIFTVDVLGPRSQVMSLGPLLRDALFMLYSWQRQSPPAAAQRSRICHLLLPYDVMYPNTGPTHTIMKALCQPTVDSQWLSIVLFQIWSMLGRIGSGYVNSAKFLIS
jgi:hypothetical protein